MNKFIKEQLLKTRTVLPEWNENTLHMVITGKREEKKTTFEVGFSYEIVLDDSYYGQEFSVVRSNWNANSNPPDREMYVTILQDMGKMKQVRAIGKMTHETWTGWLPDKVMKVI